MIFLEYKTHFGSRVLIDEVRIVMNYIFAIINIYIMFKLFFRRNTDKLKISIAIMTGIYILSICIPMILNISPSTYQEGIGQKGFFETGNSLSIILLLAVGLLLTTIKLKGRYIYLAITVFTSLYLLFIMGSRTGFYRSNITYDSIYFSKYIFIYNEKEKKKDIRYIMEILGDIYTIIGKANNSIIAKVVTGIVVFLVGIGIIIYISINGISVLNRRAELKRQEQQLIAERKNEKLPIGPKEIVNIYMDIKGNEQTPRLSEREIEERYPNLTLLDRNNIIEFIEKIQNDKFSANDLREMQETYAKIEWKNDKNIIHKLFRKY